MIRQTTLILPSKQRHQLLTLLAEKKEPKEIGLYYLDCDEIGKLFLPFIEKQFGLKLRFKRVWGHFMDKGGQRPWHKHTCTTFLYYLQIPEGDVGNFVHEEGEIIPKENDLYIFDPLLNHKITPNKTGETRWAIAAECVKG